MSRQRRIRLKSTRITIPLAVSTLLAAAVAATGFASRVPDGSGQAQLAAASVTNIAPGVSLSSVHVQAGHAYAFKNGATYTGTLNVNADNVIIGSYGTGAHYPIFTRSTTGNDITVSGSGDQISHIRLTGKGYRSVPGCGTAKTAGYEIGIDVRGTGDKINSVFAYGNLYAGIYVETAGSHATISNSAVNGVNALNPSSLGSGAFGVLLWGSHNTLNHDSFKNQSTCSPDFGRDGSGVEIYHGSYNLIEHCSGWNDSDFTELGGAGATTNTYLDNTYSAPGEFLVTRGSGDTADGPVHNTILTGNLAHGAVVSYDWRPGDGTLLTMKDNHVASLSQDGGFVNEGGNIIGF